MSAWDEVLKVPGLGPWIKTTASGFKSGSVEDAFNSNIQRPELLCYLVAGIMSGEEGAGFENDILGTSEVGGALAGEAASDNAEQFVAGLGKIGIEISISAEDISSGNLTATIETLIDLKNAFEIPARPDIFSQKNEVKPEPEVVRPPKRVIENKWTKNLAETRAGQNKVAKGFARKEDKELNDVTSAVRDFKERTVQVDELANKRTGQQKWKLFETNYQREKGITVEESLKEIEEFENNGVMPPSFKREQKPLVGAAFRSKIEDSIGVKDDKSPVKGGRNAAGFAAGRSQPGSKTTSVVTQRRVLGTPGEVEDNFLLHPQRGRKGEEFLKKFAEKDGDKFRIGGEKPKKLW